MDLAALGRAAGGEGVAAGTDDLGGHVLRVDVGLHVARSFRRWSPGRPLLALSERRSGVNRNLGRLTSLPCAASRSVKSRARQTVRRIPVGPSIDAMPYRCGARLIITRGLPASGKTTFARKLQPWVVRVNRDDLRRMLHGEPAVHRPWAEGQVTIVQRHHGRGAAAGRRRRAASTTPTCGPGRSATGPTWPPASAPPSRCTTSPTYRSTSACAATPTGPEDERVGEAAIRRCTSATWPAARCRCRCRTSAGRHRRRSTTRRRTPPRSSWSTSTARSR